MSFSISVSGHVDDPTIAEGVEQSIMDDVVAVLTKHKDHVRGATGSFQYLGEVDLVAAAGAGDPVDGSGADGSGSTGSGATGSGSTGSTDTGSGDAGGTTGQGNGGTAEPGTFVAKVAGETYPDYVARVDAWNADPANADSQMVVLGDTDWTALP